jgi:protein-disulfide isomerase
MKLIALALAALLPSLAATTPEFDKGKAVGNPAAPVKIEIYSDFECPHCQVLHQQILPRLIADYVKTGKVYLISREFPLPQHVYAREAANYATAAARIGKYAEVSDALFQAQGLWSVNGRVWETVASALPPADQKRVQELVKDPGVIDEVQADVEKARAFPITQTPTLVVKHAGKTTPLTGVSNYEILKSFLDSLLKK